MTNRNTALARSVHHKFQAGSRTGARSRTGTGTILAGLVVGPVFVGLAIIQMALRPGFDLNVHPISALSLGQFGWVQIVNFLLAGFLSLVTAVALRQRMGGGIGGFWGPILVGTFGAGLMVSGAFPADGAFGFPAGSPIGLPAHASWHSVVHNSAAQVSFGALIAASLVFFRRFAARREIAMATYTLTTPLAVVAAVLAPGDVGFSLRLFIGVTILFAWLAVTSVVIGPAATAERSADREPHRPMGSAPQLL